MCHELNIFSVQKSVSADPLQKKKRQKNFDLVFLGFDSANLVSFKVFFFLWMKRTKKPRVSFVLGDKISEDTKCKEFRKFLITPKDFKQYSN